MSKYTLKSLIVATKILPEGIVGATAYVIRGRKGDANADIAIALESTPKEARGERDGLPILLSGKIQWADEPFESPLPLDGKHRGFVVLNLVNGGLQAVDIDEVVVEAVKEASTDEV